jgi:hypothetical protein
LYYSSPWFPRFPAQQVIKPEPPMKVARVAAENIVIAERTVKNAPFSADAVSEYVQTLADGNRIVRRSVTRMFRDSEGRFRREDMPKQLGVGDAQVYVPESISITDPVAGFRYSLNPKTNTFRQSPFRGNFDFKFRTELEPKMKLEIEKLKSAAQQLDQARALADQNAQTLTAEKMVALERAQVAIARGDVAVIRKEELEKGLLDKIDATTKIAVAGHGDSKYETRTESLGVQNIEGVDSEGTRSTTTIPAGAIGNERPIEIVYEKWYSKELQMTVMSRHLDPRTGEQTYRLTNINRQDPNPAFFAPPPDYKLIESRYEVRPVTVTTPKAPYAVKAVPVSTAVSASPKKPNQQ